ncbi:hypothetical protein R5R35_009674 [Gryllus longicercus]|uniref:Uncharacterized protein n=1 Tax=Gryllus longicercus TaxID=2509291 RepID=A0AAN9YXI7_9ORTH
MECIEVLAENIIKIEQVKEEPVDIEEPLNSIEDDDCSHEWCSVKAEGNVEEELEPPLAVNVAPFAESDGTSSKEEKMLH